ncbi:Acyl-coenzyme A synthetase/AMP-(fatty) acid ligase [Cupriavidus sp. YR651]|uniref:AMP-binding protein n=1 Tax=Cupriavidus sp. YR651 TaxID=1855315 RepID=UPI0008860777|nr:AMP-binding protein [Cupriavidus sp. YR651]SDD44095.1 Acyl-coenzyme A synthetase/AMP-(fatty) acid ligase [Cupriavidus sp. YR651]
MVERVNANWSGVGGVMAALAARAAQGDVRDVARGGGPSLDARDFVARAAAWRRMFAAAPGHRWALYIERTAEFAAALLGAWHAGKHVVLPGDTRQETLAALRGHADGLAGELPDGLQPSAPDGDAGAFDWPPLATHDTWITLFTSGSTGVPGAIDKRLAQLDAEVHTLQQAFGGDLPADVRVLGTVSHQHIYGLLFTVLWPLAAGRPMPVTRLAFHEEVVRACIDDTHPAILISSPAHLKRMPEALDWPATRPVLRAVFSSGGPLPPEAATEALRLTGRSPIEVFGSSETGGIAWRQRAVQADRWTALPGIAWRLQDGFLAVRSAHLADDDWYVCADRALPAGDDSFVLAGRADRIVKIEEKRVSLTQIEQRFALSAFVREARVTMIELDVGTRVAAAIVPTEAGQAMLDGEGRAALTTALRRHLADAIDPVALPRRWAFLAALPCNAQGKTTEAMLRDVFRRTLPAVRWIGAEGNVDGAGGGSVTASLDITEDLAIFDGHFPGTPIVPGVAQVDWVMAIAPQRLPVPARDRFARLDTLKFQAVIQPGSTVQMALTWQPESRVLGFRLTSAAGPHASGKIVFHPEAS